MEFIDLETPFPLTGSGDRTLDRLHVSTIYTDLEQMLFPRKASGADLTNRLWAECGFLWEEVFSNAITARFGPRPGEVELDNIVGSPDGYDPETGIIEEMKATWKSIKNAHPENIWKWQTQVKSYCKMLNTDTVRFHILYICGDYRGSGPLYRSYLFYYNQREIEENWELLVNHAKSKGWL